MTPATPSRIVTTVVSATAIDIIWSGAGTDTTFYSLERDSVEIAQVSVYQTAYSDTGLDAGTEYVYRVRGYNGSAYGDYSSTSSATTLADANADLATHIAASDPHPGYELESAHTQSAHNALNIDADKVDGSHASAFAAASHTHSGGDVTSAVANATDADTVDGSHAAAFVLLPGTPADYTVTNAATDRAFDADSTTLDEIADVLGTLIADLIALGLLQ